MTWRFPFFRKHPPTPCIEDEDIFVWPDGAWCYRDEPELHTLMALSGSHRILPAGSEEWLRFRINLASTYFALPKGPGNGQG